MAKSGQAYTFAIALFDNAGALLTSPTLAAGDVTVSQDGGAFSNIGTLPSVSPASSGNVEVSLTAGEMTATDYVTVKFVDQAGAEWEPLFINIPVTTKDIDDAVDVGSIGGSAEAATDLAASAATIVTGTAQTGTLSTTQMTTDLAEATDGHYIGRIVIWTSGVLKDQAAEITDYAGTGGLLTFSTVTEAPSNGDTFVIV